MKKQTCEICGNLYEYSCAHCARRVATWGNDGACEMIQMANRTGNIGIAELDNFCSLHYMGKLKVQHEQIAVLKTSLRILGYNGTFIGRFRKTTDTYLRLRQRENQAARRWRLKKDSCEVCGETQNLFIHHIIPTSWGGITDDENIITLCNPCHRKTHRLLSEYLNRLLLLKYLEPHADEIRLIARASIYDNGI